MLSEINKGFYGLRPLNQAAIQAAEIFVSPFTEIQTEASITITWVETCISTDLHLWTLLSPRKTEEEWKITIN